MERLSREDLISLVQSVFPRFPEDRRLAVLVDIPRRPATDNEAWKTRRRLAEEWVGLLKDGAEALGLEGVDLIAYPDVGSDNADLPLGVFLINGVLPDAAEGLPAIGDEIPLEGLLRDDQVLLAPTEFSTTAPLKKAAPRFGFRAATMPGFSEKMIPALKLDYGEISRRVPEGFVKVPRWRDLRRSALDPAPQRKQTV